MKIIFCSSYLEVPTTVTRIEMAQGDCTVVTSNNGIKRFFSSLYPGNKIIFIKSPPPLLKKSLFQTVKNLAAALNHKKETWRQFSGFRDNEVYFSQMAYCEFEAWLVLKLLKRNLVYYHPVVSLKGLKTRYSLYSVLYLFLNKIIYGLDLRPLWNGKCFQCSVVDHFLRNKRIVKEEFPVNRNIIKKELSRYIQDRPVLLLVGEIVEAGLVDREEYIRKMDELIDHLAAKYGKDRLAVKRHPLSDAFYSKEHEIAAVPYFIPANLIFSFFKVVIGYQTAGLFEAAIEDKVSISLLNYFKPQDENIRTQYVDYLKCNTDKTIYFPGSIRELDLILNKV